MKTTKIRKTSIERTEQEIILKGYIIIQNFNFGKDDGENANYQEILVTESRDMSGDTQSMKVFSSKKKAKLELDDYPKNEGYEITKCSVVLDGDELVYYFIHDDDDFENIF